MISCSSDSENKVDYDFSFLINREWKRVEFNIPLEFDFNLDGIKSTDMIKEFDCMKNTSFVMSSNNTLNYFSRGPLLFTTSLDPNSPNYTERYTCDQTGGVAYIGTFEMLDEDTFKIEANPVLNNMSIKEFIATFDYVNDQLIITHATKHPVSYDDTKKVYNYEIIMVEEIFDYK
jgi:hypothetical protein